MRGVFSCGGLIRRFAGRFFACVRHLRDDGCGGFRGGWAVRAVPLRPVPPPLRISHVFCLLDRVRRAAERGNCADNRRRKRVFCGKKCNFEKFGTRNFVSDERRQSRQTIARTRACGLLHHGFLRHGGPDHGPHRRRIPARTAGRRELPADDGFPLVSGALDSGRGADEPLGPQGHGASGLRLHRRGADDALCRRRGLRSGVVFRGLRPAGRRQHGDPGGRQPPAGDHRSRRADDQLPHRGSDSSATLRSCCWLRSSRGWSPRRVRGGSCCRSMRALRWSGVSGCN